MINLQNKTITTKKARQLNFEIWNSGDSETFFARLPHIDKNRDNPLYGYIFKIV